MIRKIKYDVAFSVAYEELEVAKSISIYLKQKKIKYYRFDEHDAAQWGEDLFEKTLDIYGIQARFVLLISSKKFTEGKWSSIELQTIRIRKQNKGVVILRLRLDETDIDGISNSIVYIDWKNNPEEIADLIVKKVKEEKKKRKWRLIKKLSVSLLILLTLYVVSYTLVVFTSIGASVEGMAEKFNLTSSNHIPVQKDKISEGNGGQYPPPGTIPAKAQTTIEGIVLDEATTLPIEDATIIFNSIRYRTDKNGRYSFPIKTTIGDQIAIDITISKEGYDKETNNEVKRIEKGGQVFTMPPINLNKIK
jgi:TIR domain